MKLRGPNLSPMFLAMALLLPFSVPVHARSGKPAIEFVTISPDGNLIAAEIRDRDAAFIYLLSVRTGQLNRLTTASDGEELTPSFSPDGKEVAYVYFPPKWEKGQITIVHIDGSSSRQWPPQEGVSTPTFTPDGKKLVFRSAGFFGSYSPIAQPHPHGWDYHIANLDGTDVRHLTSNRFFYASQPSISPDGKLMLVATEDDLHSARKFVAYSVENGQQAFSFQPHVPHADDDKEPTINYPVFMPDGKKVLFLAASQGRGFAYDYDVYLTEPGSTAIEKLTSRIGYIAGLSVSADGNKAVFWREQRSWLGNSVENEIFLLNLTTRNIKPFRIDIPSYEQAQKR